MRKSVLDNTFQLLEELGRGGFGAVYRAVRIGFEGSGAVAIKLLNKNPSINIEEYFRFQREAVIMSQLVHPGVVAVHELGEEAGCYFIVMEYVEGSNLKSYVKDRGGSLPLTEILEILIQAAEALEYVHGHHIVHRDIKPQNILVCKIKDGSDQRVQIKIVDFGVARLNDAASADGQTNAGQNRKSETVGTYAYMSPEATGLTKEIIDQRSDIYSLGIVAFELLAGRVPFYDKESQEIMLAHVKNTPPTLEEVRGGKVPEIFEALVKMCIEKKLEDRYQSMFALVCDLRLIQQTLSENRAITTFPLATKDIGLQALFAKVFVGRESLQESMLQYVMQRSPTQQGRLTWGLVRGGVGIGKSRLIQETMLQLQKTNKRQLYIRFSESEKGLPFQSLSFSLNDFFIELANALPIKNKELLENISLRLGDAVAEIAVLIPVLRSLLKHFPPSTAPARSAYALDAMDLSEQESHEPAQFAEDLDQQVASENLAVRINQSFYEVLSAIAEVLGEFVIFLDDIHLADSSSLGFLQFLAEKVNESVDFVIVLSLRERLSKSDLALESLLRSLSSLRRRIRVWDLPALDSRAIKEFLEGIGVTEVSMGLVEYVVSRTSGSPFQLHSLVKRMLAHNVLLVVKPKETEFDLENIESRPAKRAKVELSVDWDVLPELDTGFVNIEVLITQLDLVDARDKGILNLVAVSHEACEFDFFMIDPDLSRLELETRLNSLVKRGFLQIVGDETTAIFRRSFLLSHEKMRTAILQQIGSTNRRVLHLRLAEYIEGLYRNPTRYHVLLLAKHYDGAADLVNPEAATRAFLNAIRVLVRKQQHSLAKYYIDKTVAKAELISDKNVKKRRLRDVFEAEYTISAVQGNLISAAEICQRLIPMTEESEKREILQVFLSQLLIALGQQKKAHKILSDVVKVQGLIGNSWYVKYALLFYFFCRQHKFFRGIAQLAFWKKPAKMLKDVSVHALALKLISELHGVEKESRTTLFAGLDLQISKLSPTRWSAMFSLLEAIHLMRSGEIQAAFRMAEKIEKFLLARGHSDALRWARILHLIWLDYPLGRTQKLFKMLENRVENLLPTSGLLHFETSAMRSWMRLLSPSSAVAKVAEEAEQKKRRRQDWQAGSANGQGRSNEQAVRHNGERAILGAEWSLESQGSRRVLDAGENGHFTSLALFSDAVRYSLFEKVDPLHRACDQLGRQKNVSAIGYAFTLFSLSLLNIITGKHREGRKTYEQALITLEKAKLGVVALPVTDALRFALLFIPLVAVGSQAKGWPWGKKWLATVSPCMERLTEAEGRFYPKRFAVHSLFQGFCSHMGGNSKRGLSQLSQAVELASSQKLELIEFLALVTLGMQLAQMKEKRAREPFEQAIVLAQQLGWKMLEKQTIIIAKRLQVKVSSKFTAVIESDSMEHRDTSYSKLLGSVLSGIQNLSGKSSAEEILSKACSIAQHALRSNQAFAFLIEDAQPGETGVQRSGNGQNFKCIAQSGVTGVNGAAIKGTSEISVWEENDIKPHLARTAQEAIRLALLKEKDGKRNTPGLFKPLNHDVQEAALVPLSVIPTYAFEEGAFNAGEHEIEATAVTAVPLSSMPTVALRGAPEVSLETEVSTDTETESAFGDAEPTKIDKTGMSQRSADPSSQRNGSQDWPLSDVYVVMIAVHYKAQLIGWVCVPGVDISNYAAMDIEQELQLLGLHCGHMLRHLVAGDVAEPPVRPGVVREIDLIQLSRNSIDGVLPSNTFLEGAGKWVTGPSSQFKVYAIPRALVLVAQWNIKGGDENLNKTLVSTLSRHLEFFVLSLRKGHQPNKVNVVAQKLAGDFSSLLQSFKGLQKINEFSLTFIVLDSANKVCCEASFGAEKWGFSGNFKMQSEVVKEVALLNGSDRLILRHNQRVLLGTCGWMFALDRRSLTELPKFAGANFLDKYIQLRRSQLNPLKLALVGGDSSFSPACLCLFYLDDSQDNQEKYVG